MRVLVADDHSLFRDGIVSLLEAAGFTVVGQVGDGFAAAAAARQLRPDLVLLDIHMPGQTGLEALRQIKAELPDLPVVMLTVSDEDADLFAAIQAGAQGYLLKSLNATEFLEILQGLKRGEAAITRKTAMRLMEGFSKTGGSSFKETDVLTGRERELLQFMVAGLSNKAIAEQLSISENTVKYHVKNILQKLGVQNRTEAATHAIRDHLVKTNSSN